MNNIAWNQFNNDQVKKLQELILKNAGKASKLIQKNGVDGLLGNNTIKAITLEVQGITGIVIDGQWGEETTEATDRFDENKNGKIDYNELYFILGEKKATKKSSSKKAEPKLEENTNILTATNSNQLGVTTRWGSASYHTGMASAMDDHDSLIDAHKSVDKYWPRQDAKEFISEKGTDAWNKKDNGKIKRVAILMYTPETNMFGLFNACGYAMKKFKESLEKNYPDTEIIMKPIAKQGDLDNTFKEIKQMDLKDKEVLVSSFMHGSNGEENLEYWRDNEDEPEQKEYYDNELKHPENFWKHAGISNNLDKDNEDHMFYPQIQKHLSEIKNEKNLTFINEACYSGQALDIVK